MGLAIENREGTAVAMCESSGFRPKTVNVTWTRQDQIERDFTPTVTDMGNNTFTLVSPYLWPLNRSHNGKTLTCSVSHMALNQPVTQTITISVLCTYVHNIFFLNYSYSAHECSTGREGCGMFRNCKWSASINVRLLFFYWCFFNSPGKSYLV